MAIKQKLNTHEAAEYLGIRPNTLEVWRCKHKGSRYAKIGARVVYDKDALDEFFNGRSIETGESEELSLLMRKK